MSAPRTCTYATVPGHVCDGDPLLHPGGCFCPATRPGPVPYADPALTLAGLRAAAGIPDVAPPLNASQLTDDRAVASGKRRASPAEVRAARAREAARKQRERDLRTPKRADVDG